MTNREREIVGRQSAQGINRQPHLGNPRRETVPSERRREGVRRGRGNRSQHREIETKRPCARELFLRMTGRRGDHAFRPRARLRQHRRGPMHAVAARSLRFILASVEQHFRAVMMSKRNQPLRKPEPARERPLPVAQLHEAQARGERAFGPSEKCTFIGIGCARDAVYRGQIERRENARIGGQQRRDGIAGWRLPGKRLSVVSVQFTVPSEHAEEMQLDVRVRVNEFLHEPGRGTAHGNPEFLVQLAYEGRTRAFVLLELAPRKFPVAGVRFAGRTLREQHRAVSPDQNRGGDTNELSAHAGRRVLSAWAPARFLANCQATRPLREPRCNANCSASRVRASVSRALAAGLMPK